MYDFKKVEDDAKKVWKKNRSGIKKAIIEGNSKKQLFSFLEGPPTANAPPGLHHLEVRTFKDIICKFKYMNNFAVPRKGGWDCHGLPVEVQIEKKLGLNSKKDILKYGVDKFIKKCRDDVFSNIKEWNSLTQELAYWIDLDDPYITLKNEYIESIWWSLKELYKRGFLYEGYKVVPFCPRCGTPLSSHEVALGYKDVKEESVYIAFKIKGKKGEYILAWTTTPWTLPGNVALAVGKNIKYVKIELPDGDKLILGEERMKIFNGDYKIIERLTGKELVGLEYEPLYDIKKLQNEKSHKIIPADFVTTEDGTGIVHTAVMYGEEDYNIGVKEGLPAVHIVGEDGKFLEIAPEFIKGVFVKDAEKSIIDDLKKRGLLFKKEKIEHSYPFCWRCDSVLLYYAINSWYVKVSKIKEKMIELNKKINWKPEHIRDGRFGKWLEGAKDWALSRFKFWGTPLPIWRCECGNEEVIGSIKELKEKSGKLPSEKIDLHKPWIDKVKIKCKCGKEMSRISDVIDCWYDSGAATFAQFHYPFENKKEFEKRFPYDFISEAIDQTRGWFYTLHVLAVALFDKPAYKNVICAGHIVDENGEKMSKSKGNVIAPQEIIGKTGVDAIRLQFCTSEAGNQKRFSYNLMRESVIPFLTILYNSYEYYKQLENKKNKIRLEDKWTLSRLNTVIEKVTKELKEYSLNNSFQTISDFVINDFSRSYIKMTRDRGDTKEIIGEVLKNVSLLLAPFAPYISEYVYQGFSRNSVHLSSWPKADNKKIDKNIDDRFDLILKIIEAGLASRDKVQIGLKWPLKSATIIGGDYKFKKEEEELIKSQLNVKSLLYRESHATTKDILVYLDTALTPELESEGFAREISRQVQSFRKKLGLRKKDRIELVIFADDELKKILKNMENFIKERTNSKKLDIIDFNVTTHKERFKNITDFKIKNKEGRIAVIYTTK